MASFSTIYICNDILFELSILTIEMQKEHIKPIRSFSYNMVSMVHEYKVFMKQHIISFQLKLSQLAVGPQPICLMIKECTYVCENRVILKPFIIMVFVLLDE